MAPEIFDQRAKDGSKFCCSDSFLRKWLHETMKWSERKATRAVHKLPDDWEDICEKSLLRIAQDIKEEDIPAALYVNTDQTQAVYAQGSNLTWAQTGSVQVSVVGEDEKRAFTAVVSVSNSGVLLPFQAIYMGKWASPIGLARTNQQSIMMHLRLPTFDSSILILALIGLLRKRCETSSTT